MDKIVLLVIGSIAGGLGRYFLGGFIHRFFGSNFPYGTMAVNLIGCFLIGFFSGISEDKFLLGSNGRLLLMIGFCGAFTTFSTFMLETGNLMRDGETLYASINVAASLFFGFVLFRIGLLVPKLIWS